jgi:myo-inositol-1-phosphate synthase
MKVRVGIAGVGNCASVLVQGLRYYSGRRRDGLWHPTVAGLEPSDIQVVAAFDIDGSKVGLDLSEAIFAKPNVARRYIDVPPSGVTVSKGVANGDVAPHLAQRDVVSGKRSDVVDTLRESRADILLNLISSGSDGSSEEYAAAALEAGCSFVNCTPSLLLRKKRLTSSFVRKRLALVGDDLMSQFGGTVFHKGLLNLMVKRGVKVSRSYQLDVGGGSETFNTIEERIKMAKREVKTSSVASEVPYKFETVAGTTDYVDYMGNERTSYFWVEGSSFLNSGISVDVYLRSSDGANAGNILFDVLRATHWSVKKGRLRNIADICGYGFKSPPSPVHFEEAYGRFIDLFVT